VFKRRKPAEELAMADTKGPALPEFTDNGLGVPPFRPVVQPVVKDAPMNRPPFAAPGSTGAAPSANPPMPVSAAPPRPPAVANARPATPLRDLNPERRTLVVGKGISLQGMVQDAERLVVEGQVESSMIHATELQVTFGGLFKGEVEVEDAEIAGTIDGTVTARGNLVVRATGVVLGTARCRRLQVEDGGQITGRIEMLSEVRVRPALAVGEN
jgi:cytoskeletal protein CcmA (bactofilin family)